MTYQEFLKTKQKEAGKYGFEVYDHDMNKNLFPFQRWIVKQALLSGRYAIFADCGLGKTLMQLEWARHISEHTDKAVLILTPLAVSLQTIREGDKFGIEVGEYSPIDIKGIRVTNYEQIDNLNADDFAGVVLDESSILKNFTGKLRNALIDKFKHTKYKLCCTATPSPNDPMELGNHSEFLGRMTRNEMLAMYFVHDGGSVQNWRLKGHAVGKFYAYVSQWAVMLARPGDIGFDNTGYDLKKLNYIEHKIKTDPRANGQLFNNVAVSATNFNQELRRTMAKRINKAAEIANKSDDQCIVWVRQNAESEAAVNIIEGAVEVTGSQSNEVKSKLLLGFANGEYKCLVTKPKIAQFGMNFQNCHKQVFAALDFSFEGLYQAVRRSYRFGQDADVDIHLITTDTMQNVVSSIKRKEYEFKRMQDELIKNQKDINEYAF